MNQNNQRSGRRIPTETARQQGSILLILIVLMVIIATLGVGMLSMFSTSVVNVFASNDLRRAQYLAESGIRYTASEVRNATPANREAALTAIDDGSVNGKWFSVVTGVERFRVRAYPYWSSTTGAGVPTNVIAATVPNSGFPPGFAIPPAADGVTAVAQLQVGPNPLRAISSTTGATPGSKAVTFTLAASVTIQNGIAAYANLAFPTTNASQTVTKGSAATPLVLNINAVSAIPQKNGEFMDATTGRLYAYRTARVVGSNARLETVSWNGAGSSATIPANTYLVFSQAARIDATGEHQQTQSARTDYVALFSSTSLLSPPTNLLPPGLTDAEGGFTNTLGALNLTGSGDRVALQGYIATGGTHAYWAAFQRLGEAGYRFPDPEQTGRNIGYHVAPIAGDISDNLRGIWMQYHNLSYDVQAKVGWDLNLLYGAQGITVRWHESPDYPGKYQGYAIGFLRFDSQTTGSDGDMIPHTAKPGSGNTLKDDLLLVLWQQKVIGGVEKKDWLAYAVLGDPTTQRIPPALRSPADPDQKVTGNQGWPDGMVNDNATLLVRVEDKFVNSQRVNEIKLFYGDGSANNFASDSRTMDRVATNKQRARYYPQWLELPPSSLPAINPRWPSNGFGLNGSSTAYWHNDLTTFDYFSLASAAPTAPNNTVTLVKNTAPRPDFTAANLLADNSTVRTTDFILEAFAAGRPEIGLYAMGNLYVSGGYPITVAFDDFRIQILGGY